MSVAKKQTQCEIVSFFLFCLVLLLIVTFIENSLLLKPFSSVHEVLIYFQFGLIKLLHLLGKMSVSERS